MKYRLPALAAIALLAPMLSSCGGDSPPTAAGVDGQTRQVTVYDFARLHGDLRLYPSLITVTDSGDPVLDAVRGLFQHMPTADGHQSLWVGHCAPGLDARQVHVTKRVVTVDVEGFPSDNVPNANCDLSVEGWNAQRQQLAWTVRTADGVKTPVRGTLDGSYTFLERTVARTRWLASAH
jgi:hypothetical protein